jgi:hypothetical protein
MAKALGWLSQKYESGHLGAAAIGNMQGDPGGKSYGVFQLAKNTGTLSAYIRWSIKFGKALSEYLPGSAEFDAVWRTLAKQPEFGEDQTAFITNRLYKPVRNVADEVGIPDQDTINNVIFSMAVQHGRAALILRKLELPEGDRSKKLYQDIIHTLFEARTEYVKHIGLPSGIITSLLDRYKHEQRDAINDLEETYV